MATGGILVAILLAYAATLVVSSSRHHEDQPRNFNLFTTINHACETDDGTLVTTDTHGTPMAFATPDGPERYWCVSKDYLSSIGHAPEDPLPSVRRIPSEYKWRWPRTTYGQ